MKTTHGKNRICTCNTYLLTLIAALAVSTAQAQNRWVGTAADNDLATGSNWQTNEGIPGNGFHAQFDGSQAGNLLLGSSADLGFELAGHAGMRWTFTSAQTANVTINTTQTIRQQHQATLIEPGAGAVTFDGMLWQLGNNTDLTRNFDFKNDSANTLTLGANMDIRRSANAGQRNLRFTGSGRTEVLATIGPLSGGNVVVGTFDDGGGTVVFNGINNIATTDWTVRDGATLGGNGTIAGNLEFQAGSKFLFDAASTLTVGRTVSFASFSISDIVGLDDTVAEATYTLIDGTVNFDNVSNVGIANAVDLGGGKSAYFEDGSLNLVVIPEPAALGMMLAGMTGLLGCRRLFAK